MTTSVKENLLDWLRDAHAMEKQAEKMLQAQAARLEHYPELRTRIEQHLQETLGQQNVLQECIARQGGDTSAMKDFGGQMMAMMQGMGGMTASDEVVKGSMASYAFEHAEVAMYTVLIAAAEAADDLATKRACEGILAQEKAMAQWILEHMPDRKSVV